MTANLGDINLEMKSTNSKSAIPENVTVSWKDLTVATDPSLLDRVRCKGSNTKEILKNLNGIVKPGEMVALMGAR